MDLTKYPKVTIVIPTLNASNVLEACINSIADQEYPKEMIELLISDGGSTDSTLEIANRFGAKIVENPLKTGEAGKAVGVKFASGEYIALIDSDNILPYKDWLKDMIEPLIIHVDAVGSEPWQFEWRAQDGFIDRYCALMGMNDPICYFIGNYDRLNVISGKWTAVPHTETDYDKYVLAEFTKEGIPTIGANGTVFRTQFLKNSINSDYLFDIDIIAENITKNGSVKFIKVKNSIIHNYCGTNVSKFIRKQRRRITDLMYYREINARKYNWSSQTNGISKFILYSILVFPLFIQALQGYIKKRDVAWFFHPVACLVGLFINTWGVIFSSFKSNIESRSTWSQ